MEQNGRVRLVEFLTNFKIGGTERQVVNLTRGLDPRIFELHVACLGRSGEFLNHFDSIPLAEYRINSLYNSTMLKEQWRFGRYLKRHHIQIVHSYGFYSNVFSVFPARIAGAVAIASIRDIGDPLTSMQKRVQKVVCSIADYVLANSAAVKNKLIADGYCPEKIGVIRNGIAMPSADEAPRGRFRGDLGLPENARIVAVIARLNPLKGIEDFLQAAAIIASRFENVFFAVVGDGIDPAYTASLKERTERLGLSGRVIYTGFRLDVPSILHDVSISVLPSLSEGLSNVLLESMAAGVPVVATSVGGNLETVEDGVSGILVSARAPEALAEAVSTLLLNPTLAARFGACGRERVKNHFSLDRMLQETQRLYIDLLRRVHKLSLRKAAAL